MNNIQTIKNLDPNNLPKIADLLGCDWLCYNVLTIIAAILALPDKFSGNIVELAKAAIKLAVELSLEYWFIRDEKGFSGLHVPELVVKQCWVEHPDNPDDDVTGFVIKREILTEYLAILGIDLKDVEKALAADGFFVFYDTANIGTSDDIVICDLELSNDYND